MESIENKSAVISKLCLLLVLFLFCGWKTGLAGILLVLIIEAIIGYFEKRRINKIKKEISRKLASGALPYSCYIDSDSQAIYYKIILDETLSPISTGDNAPGFIIFLTRQKQDEIIKNKPKTDASTDNNFSNINSYYTNLKDHYDTYSYSMENLKIIQACIEEERIDDDFKKIL